MLKKFFITVLGSFVGTMIALIVMSVLSVVLSFAMLGALASSEMSKVSTVSDNSVLLLDLGMSITERATEGDVINMMMYDEDLSTTGLHDLIAKIEKAAEMKQIKGMLISCKGISAGTSSLYELRQAVEKFKQSGKFVYAYGYQSIAQADYYLASAADSIFVNPEASVDLHGLAAQNIFFKNLLDKIGVEMQVLRVGTYKGAVEPYMLSEISEANRAQQEHYMGSIWSTLAADIAKGRNLSVEKVNEYADSLVIAKSADYLLANGLVDGICYKKEMEKKIEAITGSDLNLVKPDKIALTKNESGDCQVAVLYAEGEIDGSTTEGIISDEMVDIIYELAENDDVKAMVLRVNSPGGSAFGSEQIWKALEDFKAEGKTLVVSMGDLAASGGYYISCGANRIFAEPVTLTGSIGIFGVIPCVEKLANETLGITTSTVKTNANGDFGSLLQKMTPYQRDALQAMVNRGYETFTKRCADGRGVTQDSIKVIAEGRVWEGTTALEIGLVDEMGSLKDAIAWAAADKDIADIYYVKEYPTTASKWERMLQRFIDEQTEAKMRQELGVLYDYHKEVKKVLNRQSVLCLMDPIEIK